MSTKRIMRLIIVLFLLATLPVMAAVMAQEQEPVFQAPVISESSGSPSLYAPNKSESESNNTRGTADSIVIGDVVGGKIGTAGDVDYFKFTRPQNTSYVLIVIDAASLGSPMNSNVCLENSSGTSLACNDDTDTTDSFLFYAPPAGDYYIKVTSQVGAGGNNHTYELTLSSPLLVSAGPQGLLNGGDVGGVHFYSEDVLAHADLKNGAQKWWMLFDGSDVGVKLLTNFAAEAGSSLIFTVGQNISLGGIAFTPYDIAQFTATRLGTKTQGTFAMGLKGSDHGLTAAAEKLDAIDGWVNGADNCYGFPVSTTGIAEVPGPNTVLIKVDDEDVFCKVYDGSWKFWTYFFDVKGKRNAPNWWDPQAVAVPNMAAEDVIAMAYNDTDDKIFLTIQGTGVIRGNAVNNKQIFALNYPAYSWDAIAWDGPSHGWNYNLDAIEVTGTMGGSRPNDDTVVNILPIGDSLTYGWRLRQGPAKQVAAASSCRQTTWTGTAITVANRKVFASYRLPLYQMFAGQLQYTFDFMGTNAAGSDKTYNFAGYPNKGMPWPSADDINFVGYPARTTADINSGDSNAKTPDVQFALGVALPAMKAQAGFAKPDVALVHLGTNDINKAKQGTSTANLNQIIAKLRNESIGGNANINIYIAQIIPNAYPSSCASNTFAATCAKFNYTCGSASPVESYNTALSNWCGPTGSGNTRRCANLSTAASDVYLVNQYSGFDVENWLLPSDEVHLTRNGECQMALRWYEALKSTEYPNLPAQGASFCNDYPLN